MAGHTARDQRIQDRSLDDLFQTFRRDSLGRHDTQEKGEGTVPLEDTRPYVYGDSLANLDLHETIKNAYVRQGGGVPIRLSSEDYVVHETEYQTRCATVVLIDMSGSMNRYGKYYTTKKVALALQAMVRARYPQDSLQMIGFYTFANLMNERQLVNSAPKQVSMFDSRINLRFDMDKPAGRVPQHFTNIHAGLRLAQRAFASAGSQQANHCDHRWRADGPHRGPRGRADLSPGGKDRHAHAGRGSKVRNVGIRVSSFALIEDYFYLGLVNFVEEMARVSKGVAAYCSTDEIGDLVFDSFIGGRRTRRHSN